MTGCPQAIVQPEECRSPQREHVVSANATVSGGIYADALSQRAQVARPDACAPVDGEVEARFTKPLAGRDDREGAVTVSDGAHYDHGISVRKRENNAHTRPIEAWYLAERVAAGVQHVARAEQATHPGGHADSARGRIHELDDLTGHAAAGIETGERNVELLQSPTEEHSEQSSERTEQAAPLSPRVKLERRGPFIELGYSRIHRAGIEGWASQQAEVLNQTGARIATPNMEVRGVSETIEDVGPNTARLADRTIEPGFACEVYAPPGNVDPALSQPVNQVTSRGTEPDE